MGGISCICHLFLRRAGNAGESIHFYRINAIWYAMKYRAEITTQLKEGMLDPEGATIQRALLHLGYDVSAVHTAKKLLIELEADSAYDAAKMMDVMCQKLLANPVIHNYSIKIQ